MKIDQNILEGCLREERKAQSELYRLLYDRFMGMCIRYRENKNDAVVSLNTAFVKILSNLNELKDLDVFEGWAKRIIINQMLTEIKKASIERDRTESIDHADLSTYTSTLNTGEQKLDAEYLKQLLKALPTKTNHVFNLFAIDGYSHKEISKLLEISEGTSKWHVSEARQLLKIGLQTMGEKQKMSAT